MPEWKTCSTKESRKRHDNGSGKLWTFSRYHQNDSCGDVNADDCPSGYKYLKQSYAVTRVLTGRLPYGDADQTIPIQTLCRIRHNGGNDPGFTKDCCWQSGNWHQAYDSRGATLATDDGTYPNRGTRTYYNVNTWIR